MFLGFTILFLSTVSEYHPPHLHKEPPEKGQSRAPGSGEGDKDDLSALSPLPVAAGASLALCCGFQLSPPCAVFAFSGTYTLLFIARALQGIGSSFSSVAGEGFGCPSVPASAPLGWVLLTAPSPEPL